MRLCLFVVFSCLWWLSFAMESNFDLERHVFDPVRACYSKTGSEKYLHYKKNYKSGIMSGPEFQQWFKAISSFDESERCVLDLGCASGYPLADTCIRERFDYKGIDLSDDQIALAKELHPDNENCFEKVNMIEHLSSAKSGSFAGVSAIWSLLHVPRDMHKEIISDIFRVLRPKGVLLLTLSFLEYEGYIDEFLGSRSFYSQFAVSDYSPVFTEAGFKVLENNRWDLEFEGKNDQTWFVLLQKP
jgi:SAM-dependent methyltransferase